MIDEAKRSLVQNWLLKAQRDLATARKLVADPDPYLDTAIYHCQQAAGDRLTPYATAFRYPGEMIEPDQVEFHEALRDAEQIYTFVLSMLPTDVQPSREEASFNQDA